MSQKPDLICVTGDFITDYGEFDAAWYSRALKRLTDAAPVFATLGNHDGGTWSRNHGGQPDSIVVRGILADAGIRGLHNGRADITVAGKRVEVVGLGDLWADEFRPEAAFGANEGTPRIVLSHNPDTKDLIAGQTWRLMLSGHTHGGQVVVPAVGSPWAPVRDQRYLHGLKAWEGRMIHVTSGVGNALGYRLNCPPEVVVLDVRSNEKP